MHLSISSNCTLNILASYCMWTMPQSNNSLKLYLTIWEREFSNLKKDKFPFSPSQLSIELPIYKPCLWKTQQASNKRLFKSRMTSIKNNKQLLQMMLQKIFNHIRYSQIVLSENPSLLKRMYIFPTWKVCVSLCVYTYRKKATRIFTKMLSISG